MEEWKDIPGYEGHYQVSNCGNVRSVKKEPVILKGDYQPNGYKRVYLWMDGGKKNLLVHRLVAIAFLPNPNDYIDINHIDEDKTNNCVDNLQWCSHLYNMNYGHVKEKISKANRGKTVSEEVLLKLSESSKNRKWINNGIVERSIKKSRLSFFISEGWKIGRLRREKSNDRKSKSNAC